MDLSIELTTGRLEIAVFSQLLDGLTAVERLAAVRSLTPRAQASLFDAACGARTLVLDDIVPLSVPARTEVPHLGKNSMTVFTQFAKVFYRPEPGAAELYGYNRCSGFVETVVGPGYYVTYPNGAGELLVDYVRLPADKLDGWPKIIPNEARLGRFVYAGMVDVLRGVSRHVTIGRAIRHGKAADNWFVLCRGAG